MSYCTIYAIVANGDVVHAGEARNNHGFAPLFWDIVGKQQGFGGFPWMDEEKQGEFWKLYRSGKLSERDDILMGATCDNVWVARANIPRLSRALRDFYAEHCQDKVSTMIGVADVLDEVAADDTNRGACFNLCSANSNPWVVENADDEQPFNFDRDVGKKCVWGRDPFELFEKE